MSTTASEGVHFLPLGPGSDIASAIPSDKPVTMVIFLRFRDISSHAASLGPPMSGQEAFITRYSPIISGLAEKFGIKMSPVYLGASHASLMAGRENGEGEKWDVVVLSRYDSFADYVRLMTSEEYERDAMPWRLGSVEAHKWRRDTSLGATRIRIRLVQQETCPKIVAMRTRRTKRDDMDTDRGSGA
ncbi:hypothetical protein M406DRAFT_332836 [Cryphonectria parasitica EP155]|uniref:Uncharacterized protein n=1 Tax=Cryphonectria parasitica (strain ATCC 38755 / EP155) TaxID=660469 RepID=A0A9P5CKP1_CRYP1|nr:uncharacterized protein M406DRAFT_332836 [Cryphonectria parasitica EP155]KAF3762454.1 hypothetical protein M406DRAFT_332836 [Cryphonectria parasitica EP155]